MNPFFRTVEIAACGVSSEFSSAGGKYVENTWQSFTACSVSVKESGDKSHAALTNQRRLAKRSIEGSSNKVADSFVSNVFCSFVCLCYVYYKLIATAAWRNSSFSLSERESIATQETVLSIRGEVRSNSATAFLNRPGVNIRSIERQASGEHRVALSGGVQAPSPKQWPIAGCHNQGLQNLMRLRP